ncbi:MAG: hypothetical protein R3C05_08185 [Pirellulaceae bacterium]
MKTALEKTYDWLATSPNEASEDILQQSLLEAGSREKILAMKAMLRRDSSAAFDQILRAWESLSTLTQQLAAEGSSGFMKYVADAVKDLKHPLWRQANQVIEALNIYDALPDLVRHTESAPNRSARQEALRTVIALTASLGSFARRGVDRPTLRKPVLQRLAVSVESLQFHRCDELVDAFLSVAVCSDTVLQSMLEVDSPHRSVLCDHLRHSTNPSVIDLLAGWIHKAKIPAVIRDILSEREDLAFRDALLRHVGPVPGMKTLRNIKSLERPAVFSPKHDERLPLEADARAALIQILYRLESAFDRVRRLAIEFIESGDASPVRASASILRGMGPLPFALVYPEAVRLAQLLDQGADYEHISRSLLWRQIQLLDFPCEHVRSSNLISLTHLTLKGFLDQNGAFGFDDVVEIASVLRLVDSQPEQYVIDTLKHPLIERRKQAVDVAAALQLIDAILDRLRDAFEDNHLEVKVKIAASLRHARGNAARTWLDELRQLPPGPIRDAANSHAPMLLQVQ